MRIFGKKIGGGGKERESAGVGVEEPRGFVVEDPKLEAEQPKRVEVDTDQPGLVRLGIVVSQPGETFKLDNLLGEGRRHLGRDRITQVMIETGSSVYQLDEEGHFERRSDQRGHLRIGTTLNRGKRLALSEKSLEIGQPFAWSDTGSTSPVTKVVAITDREYRPGEIEVEGTSDIVERFKRMGGE